MPRLGSTANRVNYRGAYAAGTTYAVNDLVTYSGGSYIAVVATTGNLPTDTNYWAVFAASGLTGGSVGSSPYPLWFGGNKWNFPAHSGVMTTTTFNTTQTLGYCIRIPNPCLIAQIAVLSTTVGSGGSVSVALYNDSGAGLPTTLIPTAYQGFSGSSIGVKYFSLATVLNVTQPRHLWVMYASYDTTGPAWASFTPNTSSNFNNIPAVDTRATRQFASVTVGSSDITTTAAASVAVATQPALSVWFQCASATV